MSTIPVIQGWIILIGVLVIVMAVLMIGVVAFLAVRYLKPKKP